jgi:hypothetical protein
MFFLGYVLNEDPNKLYGGYFPRIYVRRLTKTDFVYDDESGAYYYKTDITNYNYNANTDTWIPIGGTSATPVQKEEPKKTVEPVRPPSQSVSISDSAHRRMSIIATGHMSMQLQTVSETFCDQNFSFLPLHEVSHAKSQHYINSALLYPNFMLVMFMKHHGLFFLNFS